MAKGFSHNHGTPRNIYNKYIKEKGLQQTQIHIKGLRENSDIQMGEGRGGGGGD